VAHERSLDGIIDRTILFGTTGPGILRIPCLTTVAGREKIKEEGWFDPMEGLLPREDHSFSAGFILKGTGLIRSGGDPRR
jgi:hypothetical protein